MGSALSVIESREVENRVPCTWWMWCDWLWVAPASYCYSYCCYSLCKGESEELSAVVRSSALWILRIEEKKKRSINTRTIFPTLRTDKTLWFYVSQRQCQHPLFDRSYNLKSTNKPTNKQTWNRIYHLPSRVWPYWFLPVRWLCLAWCCFCSSWGGNDAAKCVDVVSWNAARIEHLYRQIKPENIWPWKICYSKLTTDRHRRASPQQPRMKTSKVGRRRHWYRIYWKRE